jgi:hypothetical protein
VDSREEARLARALKKLEKAGVEAFRPGQFPQEDRLRCRWCGQVFWQGSREWAWYRCPNGCRVKTDAEETLGLPDKRHPPQGAGQ